MPTTTYDFQITVAPMGGEEGFRVTLQPMGDHGGRPAIPLSATGRTLPCACLPHERASLERYHLEPLPPERAEEIGSHLAEFLLPPALWMALCARIYVTPADSIPQLRLWLDLQAATLTGLPWELLRPPEQPDIAFRGFLCHDPRFHLARLPATAPTPKTWEPPKVWRALVAWADPQTAAHPAIPSLMEQVEVVQWELRHALAEQADVVVVPHATPTTLQAALSKHQPHLLHFIGHGEPEGLILHGDAPRTAVCLAREQLVEWVGVGPTRLAILAACWSAETAHLLACGGVPMAVGMQLPLEPDFARSFTGELYARLTKSQPLDVALAGTRRHYREKPLQGSIPVLYHVGRDGRLFTGEERPATPLFNLDRRNPRFVGRETSLAEIASLLSTPGQGVALVGIGGMGKSELATEYAYQQREAFPGGIYWLDAESDQTLMEGYAQAGRQFLKVSPDLPLPDQARLARERLQERTALLLLDNWTERTDPAWLPTTGSCRLLATTREATHLPDFHIYSLPPLDAEAGLKILLEKRLQLPETERNAARRIVAETQGHPLALTLIASYLNDRDMGFAEYLAEYGAALRSRSLEEGLGEILDSVFARLMPQTLSVLTLAACFAGQGIRRDLLAEACRRYRAQLPDATIDRSLWQVEFDTALWRLEAASLLTREMRTSDEMKSRLTMHAVIREHAWQRAETTKRDAVRKVVAEVLTEQLRPANDVMDWQQTRREMSHAHAVAEHYREADCGKREGFAALLLELGIYHCEHDNYTGALQLLQEGETLLQQQGAQTSLLAARLMGQMGEVYQRLYDMDTPDQSIYGQQAESCSRLALQLAEPLLPADALELADFCNGLGFVLKMQGQTTAALPYYERALHICEQRAQHDPSPRSRSRVATCLNYLGTWWEKEGDFDRALEFLKRAWAIDADPAVWGHEHIKVAIRLNNIGRVSRMHGLPEEALRCHLEALEIYDKTYTRPNGNIADTLYYLAKAQQALDRPSEARSYFQEASQMYFDCFGNTYWMLARIEDDLAHLA